MGRREGESNEGGVTCRPRAAPCRLLMPAPLDEAGDTLPSRPMPPPCSACVCTRACVSMWACVRACVGMRVWVCGRACVSVWACVCECVGVRA